MLRRSIGLISADSVPLGYRPEQVAQLRLVVPPSGDGACIDGLAHLAETGRLDPSLRPVKLQAGRLVLQAARRQQVPCCPFDVRDGVLIIHLVDPYRHDASPVIHQAQILFKARAHVTGVAGPGDVFGSEVGESSKTRRHRAGRAGSG